MSWQHWVLLAWLAAEVVYAASKIGTPPPERTATRFACAVFTFIAWGFLAVTG